MDSNALVHILLATMPVPMTIKAMTSLTLWLMLRRQDSVTSLGTWINRFFLSIFLMSVLLTFLLIYFWREAEADDIDSLFTWSLLVGLNTVPLIASVVGMKVAQWTRRTADYTVSNEGVFGTLARAMPVIVADKTGTIHYTTKALDTLVGAKQDELCGKNLTELMPERYRAQHRAGMKRYLATGATHIIGTVVSVDLLTRDGQEKPVYLALTTADVHGDPWFVGAIWNREVQQVYPAPA